MRTVRGNKSLRLRIGLGHIFRSADRQNQIGRVSCILRVRASLARDRNQQMVMRGIDGHRNDRTACSQGRSQTVPVWKALRDDGNHSGRIGEINEMGCGIEGYVGTIGLDGKASGEAAGIGIGDGQ